LAEAALKALQIDTYFTAMRTSGEVNVGKPSPDIYLKVAEDMQVRPEHCLVFEDVPMGILAGKRAGMQVCAVYDEFSRPLDQEKKKLADYYIHDFHDVMDRIKERNTDGK
ncbi:MAG TPA: HAD-IA family hydrolase, partial [Candidatus Sellimonas avistercoris]|nr:HAD-IA family hydrolase [Candidatus Sellimonas avistercoris]